MTKQTKKIKRFKGGADPNNVEEAEKKKTMKTLELIAKSPATLGLRNRYFVKEEMCKFDINRPTDYRGNKTQDNLRTKLNKCKLFNKDPKLKKFMKEKLIDSCKTYHDVTAIIEDDEKFNPKVINGQEKSKFSLKYFNHCTNFFECFHDTSELIYLFKDAIEGDKFLEIIIREKDEEKIRREINEKTQARYKEVTDLDKESLKSGIGKGLGKEEQQREDKLQETMDKRAKEKDEIYLDQEKLKNDICKVKKEIHGQFG